MKDHFVLPNSQTVSMDSLMTGTNNNVTILGASGTGKSRRYVRPNLERFIGSYIISDPKQSLFKEYKDKFEKNGYRVVLLSFIHPENSSHYNMLHYVKTGQDITAISYMLINSHDVDQVRSDPFWDEAGTLLLSAIIGMLVEQRDFIDGKEVSIADAIDLFLKMGEITGHGRTDSTVTCVLDDVFEKHSAKMNVNGKESFAHRQYKKFKCCPEKTRNTVIITIQASLSMLDGSDVKYLMAYDEIDMVRIGHEKTAIFVEASETDRSMDTPINIFYSQLLRTLCDHADLECEGSKLPVPVRFFFDDFATNCRIKDFDKIISNIRSRNISASLMLQSEAQLKTLYGDAATTIIDNCDTIVYMGGNNIETARSISERCNKTVQSVLNMPLFTCWIFRRGEEPVFDKTYDYEEIMERLDERDSLEERME